MVPVNTGAVPTPAPLNFVTLSVLLVPLSVRAVKSGTLGVAANSVRPSSCSRQETTAFFRTFLRSWAFFEFDDVAISDFIARLPKALADPMPPGPPPAHVERRPQDPCGNSLRGRH